MDEEVSKKVHSTKTNFKSLSHIFNHVCLCFLLKYFADPLIAMDHILDSLKLLDYENQFCKQK